MKTVTRILPTPTPAQMRTAIERIREVRRESTPIEIPFPAHEALICEDCGHVSHSRNGDVTCGKCSSKATLWLSQLIHITGKARRTA